MAQDKYEAEIKLAKNIIGLGLVVFLLVANVMYDKEINLTFMLVPVALLKLDISKFLKK